MRCNKAVDECICDEYVVIGNREYNIGALLNLFEIGVKVNGVYGFGGKIFCAWCNRPIDLCICGGCVVTGSNQSSDQLVASGTWTVGGGGNGGDYAHSPAPEEDKEDPKEDKDHRCPCMIPSATKEILKKLDSSKDNGYYNLTKDLKRQIAFPEIVQQGNNGTCAAAALQKYLAENYPNKYQECVYGLVNDGSYEPWSLGWADDDGEYNPIGITEEEIKAESGVPDMQKKLQDKGIAYTSVDAIIQSAIQTRVNTGTFWKMFLCFIGKKQPGYDPRLDDGEGGGMKYQEMCDFIDEYISDDLIVDESKNVVEFTYDGMEKRLQDKIGSDFDSYSVFAFVDIETNKNGGYCFKKGDINHLVEITGMENGQYIFWSYGDTYSTSGNDQIIKRFIIVKKTDHAKREKAARKTLTCNCSSCSGNGCGSCM